MMRNKAIAQSLIVAAVGLIPATASAQAAPARPRPGPTDEELQRNQREMERARAQAEVDRQRKTIEEHQEKFLPKATNKKNEGTRGTSR
jgi:hypothetical protein